MYKTVFPFIAAAAVLSACTPKPDEDAIKGCWAPDVKSTVPELVKQNLSAKIVSGLNDRSATAAEKKRFVDAALTVTVDNYHAESIDIPADAVSCGARASMTFVRSDGKKLSASDAYFDFEVFRGESGHMYSIKNTLPLARLITDAEASIPDDTAQPGAASDATQ